MLKKFRKSSGTVTLVLIGVAAALSGCSGQKRDVYASREDCLADWGNKPEDCSPATDSRHASRGFYYGPLHSGYTGTTQWNRSTGTYGSRYNSRSSFSGGGSSSSSRGGFGSTSRSSSSSSSS